jgi:hypothetical protein
MGFVMRQTVEECEGCINELSGMVCDAAIVDLKTRRLIDGTCYEAKVSRVQSPHKVIYLQYDPEACDEITWCQDQVDEKDTTYWRGDVVRGLALAAIQSHKSGVCSKYFPGGGCSTGKVKFLCDKCKFGGCNCADCKSAWAILDHKPE